MVKLALITVTYNSGQVLADFLYSLSQQSYTGWHLYLVDSYSTDNSLQILEAASYTWVTILPQTQNVGFAKGNNIGIAQAAADGATHLLLINNDTVFDSNFLEQLIEKSESYPDSIITPKVYQADGKTIWSAGGGFRYWQAFAAYHRGEGEFDFKQYDSDYRCDFVPMCCVLIPLQIWQQVGNLDENFFIYSEDADWFYRAKLKKVKLVYCFEPNLTHKVSSLTGGAQSFIGATYGTRNRIYFIRKHFRGLQKATLIIIYFGGMIIKLLLGKYSLKEFRWRFVAFFNGLLMNV